jgi:hypothetical protein
LLDWGQATTIKTQKSDKKVNFNTNKVIYLIIIPVLILVLFIVLYTAASSKFYDQFADIFSAIRRFLENIDFLFLVFIIFGTIVANALFMKTKPVGLYSLDIKATDILNRTRKKNYYNFKNTGLKTQFLSPERIYMGRIARRKLNAKLGIDKPLDGDIANVFDGEDLV